MLIALIIAAEIAVWSVLFSGLAARYLLGRPGLGMALLVATPVVDLALLAATTIDLRRGGEAALPHALAAVYIGVSAAWGEADGQLGGCSLRAPVRGRATARAASAHGSPARSAPASRVASPLQRMG